MMQICFLHFIPYQKHLPGGSSKCGISWANKASKCVYRKPEYLLSVCGKMGERSHIPPSPPLICCTSKGSHTVYLQMRKNFLGV